MMENFKTTCEGCRYFFQHYAKCGSCLIAVKCGHCVNRVLTPKEKRSFPYLHDCPQWEPAEIAKEERKRVIEDYLSSLCKRMEEIAFILTEDRK